MSGGGRGPPDTEGMISLKVDNLTFRTTPEDLRRHFEKYGDVGDVYIPRDRFTRESRGFAFVRYYDKRDADEAMDEMDGELLDGREIRVQQARYGRPTERRGPPRKYGGGGGGGGGRSRDRSRSPYRGSRRQRSYSRSRSRSRSRSGDRRKRRQSRSWSRGHSGSRSPNQGANN